MIRFLQIYLYILQNAHTWLNMLVLINDVQTRWVVGKNKKVTDLDIKIGRINNACSWLNVKRNTCIIIL